MPARLDRVATRPLAVGVAHGQVGEPGNLGIDQRTVPNLRANHCVRLVTQQPDEPVQLIAFDDVQLSSLHTIGLKIAVFALVPRPSVRTVAVVKPRLPWSGRRAQCKSCNEVCIAPFIRLPTE